MFSSIGQIVGLIEIDPVVDGDEHFARLISRSADDVAEKSAPACRPANRLTETGVLPVQEIALVADLAQLEADLAAAAGWLRLQLVEAATRSHRR